MLFTVSVGSTFNRKRNLIGKISVGSHIRTVKSVAVKNDSQLESFFQNQFTFQSEAFTLLHTRTIEVSQLSLWEFYLNRAFSFAQHMSRSVIATSINQKPIQKGVLMTNLDWDLMISRSRKIPPTLHAEIKSGVLYNLLDGYPTNTPFVKKKIELNLRMRVMCAFMSSWKR